MNDLEEKVALVVKQVDAGIKCSWNWSLLKLDTKIEVKGAEHTFPLVDVFKKNYKKGLARCILCRKEINYANKGSHALLAHCKTELHKKKVYNNAQHTVWPLAFYLSLKYPPQLYSKVLRTSDSVVRQNFPHPL